MRQLVSDLLFFLVAVSGGFGLGLLCGWHRWREPLLEATRRVPTTTKKGSHLRLVSPTPRSPRRT